MRARLEQALHAAWQKNGPFSYIMRPLSWLYGGVVARRKAAWRRDPDRIHHDTLPVVVVGNIYIGGTGKTPVVIAVVEALKQRGWNPGVISRGYGARPGDAPRAGQGVLDPALFGDEPSLIAAQAGVPVSVHPDRKAAIHKLRRQFPKIDVVISDDGLQHHALGRDIEIIVQDARGTGNGQVLPSGPLREPATRLASADFVISNLLPGEHPPDNIADVAHPVIMTMEPQTVEHLESGEILPWEEWLVRHHLDRCATAAAIGRPERFFDMLRQHDVAVSPAIALPDHYDYARSPFEGLDVDAILVTAKDAVKCRRLKDPRLQCVHAAARFNDPEWLNLLDAMLRAIAQRKRTAGAAEALHSGV